MLTKQLPLDDTYNDIVRKAMQGQKYDKKSIISITGISEKVVSDFISGNLSKKFSKNYKYISQYLKLDYQKLLNIKKIHLYKKGLINEKIDQYPFIKRFTTKYHADWLVNSYIIADEKTKNALIFDTGMDANIIIDHILEKKLTIKAIFITHCDYDHIYDISTLKSFIKNQSSSPHIYVNKYENNIPKQIDMLFSQDNKDKFLYSDDVFSVKAINTPGHSIASTTFLVKYNNNQFAFVGDAIFAHSIGKIRIKKYSESIKNIHSSILSLKSDTLILPGHGPVTTVKKELKHNPFF